MPHFDCSSCCCFISLICSCSARSRVAKPLFSSFLLALTTALGFSVFHFQPFAAGTTWLDFWDFLVSNNIMPIGSILLAVFCCYKVGWGWDKFLEEANAGKGLKVQPWMKPVFKYFVPAAVLFIYVYGMVNFAWKW